MLLSKARKASKTLVMFTFLQTGVTSLYTKEEKRALADSLGVDVFVEIPMDETFMRQTPSEYATDVLLGHCGADTVVVGDDFRFGHGRSGTASTLMELGREYGFHVVVEDKLVEDGAVISSTRIRGLICVGKIKKANKLLGSPYHFTGTVTEGNHIGRRLDTLTANIIPGPHKVMPPYGVYAVRCMIGGSLYTGVANLGIKPTIPGDNPVGLEVWLFDYTGDLYDRQIQVSLIDFIRPEMKFASLESLKTQIKTDSDTAKQILSRTDL